MDEDVIASLIGCTPLGSYEQERSRMIRELIDSFPEGQETPYCDLHGDRSCLDGWFTAAELRRAADYMDRLAPSLDMCKD